MVIATTKDGVGVLFARIGRRRVKTENLKGPLLQKVIIKVVLVLVESTFMASVHCLCKETDGFSSGKVVPQLT